MEGLLQFDLMPGIYAYELIFVGILTCICITPCMLDAHLRTGYIFESRMFTTGRGATYRVCILETLSVRRNHGLDPSNSSCVTLSITWYD